MTVTEVTLGEVYRMQVASAETMKSIGESLQNRPTWADLNRLEASRLIQEGTQNQAIKDLEDNSRWLVRAIAAAALGSVGAIAGVVFNATKIAG